MRTPILFALAAIGTLPATSLSQNPDHARHHPAPATKADSAFAALQKRGATVMGVDQYTSTHRFEPLRDGGRIELQRDPSDTAGVRTIREHLQSISRAFAAGDFSPATTVHAQAVPGTDVMRERTHAIRYEYRPLPGGGEVRITTNDERALRAVHEFLSFQRTDHRSEK